MLPLKHVNRREKIIKEKREGWLPLCTPTQKRKSKREVLEYAIRRIRIKRHWLLYWSRNIEGPLKSLIFLLVDRKEKLGCLSDTKSSQQRI